jgi:hypothetical protein
MNLTLNPEPLNVEPKQLRLKKICKLSEKLFNADFLMGLTLFVKEILV